MSLVCAPDFPSSFSSEFLGSEEVAAGRDEERAGWVKMARDGGDMS